MKYRKCCKTFWKTLVLVSIGYKQCEESKAALLSLTLFLPLLCSSFIQLGAASVIWNIIHKLCHQVPLQIPMQTHTHTHTNTYIYIYTHTHTHTHFSLDNLVWETSKFSLIDFSVWTVHCKNILLACFRTYNDWQCGQYEEHPHRPYTAVIKVQHCP